MNLYNLLKEIHTIIKRIINNDLYKWKAAKEQGYNLIIWYLKDIKSQEEIYNISLLDIKNLILKCVEEHSIELKERLEKQIIFEEYKKSKPKCPYCNSEFIPKKWHTIILL